MTDRRGELVWHRSKTCEGGACAEVAATDDSVMIQSAAHPEAAQVTLSHAEWDEFLTALKEGKFDHL
jgi:hypothetical protein